ncbi:TatD family hydrolase [Rothia nasisuis]|uniref:TatD family hydrolase n=1 Tax=Rothia nasisuis TaxID=2109647 RepID=UPI001F412E4A|nr:TatD family hydrolase [Rothia nasisuis]
MCTDHTLTAAELTELAERFAAYLPTEAEQTATIFQTPEPAVEGETPPAYRADRYNTAGKPSGEGTRRRGEKGEDGRRRNLVFPPAPAPLPYAIVDNHTHMDLLDGEVAVTARDALDTGEALGVGAIVQVGCDVPSSLYAVRAAHADSRVLAAVALHPNEAPKLAEAGQLGAALAAIDALAADPRVRALGETGLDYFRTGDGGKGAQEESFRAHIRMAKKHGKAVQIHDRDAHSDVVRILLDEGAPETVVFHCYSGGQDLAEICNDHGWYMSFAGTVTFKNSKGIQDSLKIARRNLILAETDAPFLTPHPFRGRPNASYMTNYTVRFMADYLDADLEELCRDIRANSIAAYGSWGFEGF